MGKYDDYKKLVFDTTLALVNDGYIQGTGGNVSILAEGEDVVIVTPSQREYYEMKIDDICVVDFELNPVEDNDLKPSMETGMHISVYKNRKDVNSVVHTHQIYASIFSILNHPIPALFDEVSNSIGNNIEVIPYGLSGSPQLLENVTSKLNNSANCYIIQNHGALSLGIDIHKAKRNAELLEKTAQVYYHALSTGKEITTLPGNIQDLLSKLLTAKQDGEIKRKSENNNSKNQK